MKRVVKYKYTSSFETRAGMLYQWSNSAFEKPTRRRAGNGVGVFYSLVWHLNMTN